MNATGIQKRIDKIVSDIATRNRYTQVCMSKDIRKGTADALVSICSVQEEEALFLTDRIMAIPPAVSKMDTRDIIRFFKNNYGV